MEPCARICPLYLTILVTEDQWAMCHYAALRDQLQFEASAEDLASQDSNPELPSCEATVPTTTPQYHPYYDAKEFLLDCPMPFSYRNPAAPRFNEAL